MFSVVLYQSATADTYKKTGIIARAYLFCYDIATYSLDTLQSKRKQQSSARIAIITDEFIVCALNYAFNHVKEHIEVKRFL